MILIVVLSVLLGLFLISYRNRIVAPLSIEQRDNLLKQTTASVFKGAGGENVLPYRLYVPRSVNEEDLPLVLYLHGAGGRGTDNVSQLEVPVDVLLSSELQQQYPSVVVVPQCPRGQEWVNVTCSTFPLQNYDQDSLAEAAYLKMVVELLGTLQDRFSIDSQRIYVIGFSMGATGAWDIITRHPEIFAGAIIYNGRSDPSKAFKIKAMPLQVFHGKFDKVSPVANARKMITELKKMDSPVIFDELYWGHGIPRLASRKEGLFPWLFSQKKDDHVRAVNTDRRTLTYGNKEEGMVRH